MTVINRTICDRCRKTIENEQVQVTIGRVRSHPNNKETKDLCDECSNWIGQFFNGFAIPALPGR